MSARHRYDGTLQMFVEERREPDVPRLRFMRWLAEQGRLEHGIAGAPAGDLTACLTTERIESLASTPRAA